MPKIIQIAALLDPGTKDARPWLFALKDDGSLWVRAWRMNKPWQRIESPPEPPYPPLVP